MGKRLNWDHVADQRRLRDAARKPLSISKKLFAEVWERAESVEEAAEVLGIEPKHVFWLRKSYGLPFKQSGKEQPRRRS